MEKSRKCDICNIDVHRASFAKHCRSEKHLESIKRQKMITPEWLFLEPMEKLVTKSQNPKPLKEIARENFRIDDKQLN